MARRAGKAASRKARQRNVPRQPRPAVPPPTAVREPATDAPATVGAVAPSAPPRRLAGAGAASAGSTLTDRERSEYHYVERDLRNIGILTAIMAALLVAAWLLFSATGIIA